MAEKQKEPPSLKEMALTTAIVALVALFALSTLFSMIVTVPPGSVGVMFDSINGGVQTTVLGEGYHIQLPFVQKIYVLEARTMKVEHPASAASSDLQLVNTMVAASYHINPLEAPTLFKQVGTDYSDKIIFPAIQEKVKATTANFKAEDLIQRREVVKTEIAEKLQETLSKYFIRVDEVSITNFEFSPAYQQAIDAKTVAQQQRQTAENILQIKQVEAQQRIAEAEGMANSTVLAANASAQATLLDAQAKAKAMELQRIQVTPELVTMKQAERWNGQLPNVVMGGNGIPLLNMNLTN